MKTPTENTEALLKIVEIEFPQIGHVYYLREEHQAFLTRLLLTLKKAAPEIAAMKSTVERLAQAVGSPLTTQAQALVNFPEPSNAPLPAQGMEHSNHTPAGGQSTADTASSTDHKLGTSGKPAASSARLSGLNRAHAAAAASRKAASRKAATVKAVKAPAVPPAEPLSTPSTGQV